MTPFQFTPQAVDDLFDIWNFINQQNSRAADRVQASIFETCEFLARAPLAGRMRPDLTSLPVRFWIVQRYPNYLIVYDPETRPLQIIRILHAARDLPSVLT